MVVSVVLWATFAVINNYYPLWVVVYVHVRTYFWKECYFQMVTYAGLIGKKLIHQFVNFWLPTQNFFVWKFLTITKTSLITLQCTIWKLFTILHIALEFLNNTSAVITTLTLNYNRILWHEYSIRKNSSAGWRKSLNYAEKCSCIGCTDDEFFIVTRKLSKQIIMGFCII